jgi:hypothetical protein
MLKEKGIATLPYDTLSELSKGGLKFFMFRHRLSAAIACYLKIACWK